MQHSRVQYKCALAQVRVPYEYACTSASRHVHVCKAHMYAYSTSACNVHAHAPFVTHAYVQASVLLPLTGSVRELARLAVIVDSTQFQAAQNWGENHTNTRFCNTGIYCAYIVRTACSKNFHVLANDIMYHSTYTYTVHVHVHVIGAHSLILSTCY